MHVHIYVWYFCKHKYLKITWYHFLAFKWGMSIPQILGYELRKTTDVDFNID
jgi:hypothetical protein